MDTQRDSKAFEDLMDRLSASLREGYKATDAQKSAYWNALKDVHLSEVRAHIERIIATATKETPFPRPRELRNRAPVIEGVPDPKRTAADRLSEQSWRDMREVDPVRYRIELGIARAARELAGLCPDDPGYEEATRDYQRWASVRYAPRIEQERAVARYAGS